MKRMRDGDVDFFVRFYRMTPPTFDELHDMVKEDLTRQFFIREPLPSEERLAIALRYRIFRSCLYCLHVGQIFPSRVIAISLSLPARNV